ncbi:hypothetical protein GCM10011348_44930 [Marinobacterium nitratireducens]|uniref:SAF domain-containing protein n=1 Tax=Marinobacterium nitratireducens TaxID=518897 RepID=A0A917ZQE4_9GAMM|nr:Flp pilus assembly protein CpaB [Marinobacterium nitratireducens]GGO88750.1 hypothetical protein GCM10011348_44930 [Marinobacterium nitratireducens]
MQVRFLRLFAILLFGLALALGLYSLQFGDQPMAPQAVPPAVQEPTEVVWVFVGDLPEGTVLAPEQLAQSRVLQRNEPDLQDAEPFYGRVLSRPVPAGSRLQASMLEPERPLHDALEPGYRALAIKVDEVTAVGGHLRTGDWVDVLFYLKANRESGDSSTARRLLSNVQVLAYGPELIGDDEQERQERSRSVVLAVPDERTSALLLAESSGTLRLSVVGQQEKLRDARADQNQTYTTALKTLVAQPVTAPPPPPPPRVVRARPRVELYLGEEKQLVSTRR